MKLNDLLARLEAIRSIDRRFGECEVLYNETNEEIHYELFNVELKAIFNEDLTTKAEIILW